MTQVEIDALCQECRNVGLAPGIVGYLRGILEDGPEHMSEVNDGVCQTVAYAIPRTGIITTRLRHYTPASRPDLIRDVDDALEQAVGPWRDALERHRGALLGLLQWQVDKPPPPTLWERLTGDQAV